MFGWYCNIWNEVMIIFSYLNISLLKVNDVIKNWYFVILIRFEYLNLKIILNFYNIKKNYRICLFKMILYIIYMIIEYNMFILWF